MQIACRYVWATAVAKEGIALTPRPRYCAGSDSRSPRRTWRVRLPLPRLSFSLVSAVLQIGCACSWLVAGLARAGGAGVAKQGRRSRGRGERLRHSAGELSLLLPSPGSARSTHFLSYTLPTSFSSIHFVLHFLLWSSWLAPTVSGSRPKRRSAATAARRARAATLTPAVSKSRLMTRRGLRPSARPMVTVPSVVSRPRSAESSRRRGLGRAARTLREIRPQNFSRAAA